MAAAQPAFMECAVVFAPGIFQSITAFMPGRAFRDWTDGYAILRAGHLAMLADKPSIVLTADTVNEAAEDGRLDIVTWLVARGVECNVDAALSAAAAEGHLDVVQYFLRHKELHTSPLDRPCHSKALVYAASGGHLAIVQDLVDASVAVDTTNAIAYAADFGQGHVVTWLENRSAKTDAPPATAAASSFSVFGNESTFVQAPTDAKQVPTHRRLAQVLRRFLRRH